MTTAARGCPGPGGPTLYLGNPPYVRHHHITAGWKDWLRRAAAEQGLAASALAGLHAHFFLATARRAVPGDTGVLITAAEWLDVNYGSLVRGLLLGSLGGRALHLIEPASPVFADVAATSVIACFQPGTAARAVRLRRVASAGQLGRLGGGRPVPAPVLRAAARWGPLLRAGQASRPPAGHVELGELCRVHRGQVTGANAVWISHGRHPLIPGRFQFPAVTQGRELLRAGPVLPDGAALRLVIDLPAELGQLTEAEREPVARFLRWAASAGAADGYVARHRTPWWRVRLGPPAPILASYMARRPPAFVRNLAAARHINIAHGLYPRDPLASPAARRPGGRPRRVGDHRPGTRLRGRPGQVRAAGDGAAAGPRPGPAGRPGRGKAAQTGQALRSSRDTTCAIARTCTE